MRKDEQILALKAEKHELELLIDECNERYKILTSAIKVNNSILRNTLKRINESKYFSGDAEMIKETREDLKRQMKAMEALATILIESKDNLNEIEIKLNKYQQPESEPAK